MPIGFRDYSSELVHIVDRTGLTSAIAPTFIFTPSVPGAFLASAYIVMSQQGTGGTFQVAMGWTDEVDGHARFITPTIDVTLASRTEQGQLFLRSKAGSGISYEVDGTGITGAPIYNLYIRIQEL